ncbi:hypothetical protein CTAYLR_009516 [Chrysophaeum taylorii]|uniref:SAM domain-containing protein n=1 Tax=Chrysophaeum taylorii TaxID=2483200 RepID=A0AAD7ULS0_9STRA|nr:hypothetical protein CTAYLR_009516 [Chrysophaeum taylorii]
MSWGDEEDEELAVLRQEVVNHLRAEVMEAKSNEYKAVRAVEEQEMEVARLRIEYEALRAENKNLAAKIEAERAQLRKVLAEHAEAVAERNRLRRDDIDAFLKNCGLDAHLDAFRREQISSVRDLAFLKEDDYASVLKLKVGPRAKLREALKNHLTGVTYYY